MSTSLFHKLPARPPTPPREVSKTVDDAISFLRGDDNVAPAARESAEGNSSSASLVEQDLVSEVDRAIPLATKKVDFSPTPIYHQSPRPGQLRLPNARSIRHSASAKGEKPPKSILKSSNVPALPTPDDLESRISFFSPETPGSFAKMLQSAFHQLAGNSRASRLDAYLALNGVLQAYGPMPDVAAMTHNMNLIMQFLTRDMVWKDTEGRLDTQIVVQALKLTCVILFNAVLSEALDDDFRTFLIDRSIMVMENSDVQKQIIKSHLVILSQQQFHHLIMTPGRADRLINALQTIEHRCSGNNAISNRVTIYKRLLEQAPTVMSTKDREWLQHVLQGMLSSTKEIRNRAIDCCVQAGLVLGSHPQISKTLDAIFEAEVEEGTRYRDFFRDRLIAMIGDKEVGSYVPQIWSAIVLMFRSKRRPFAKWQNFQWWSRIIQKCFNSSDLTIRHQAYLAWDKLVFAVMPDSSTSTSTLSTLKVPICIGLEKRSHDQHAKQNRQSAVESYVNLLHYAMRPGLSHEEIDNAWDVFVGPLLAEMLESSAKGRHMACRILHAFFVARSSIWNPNAALNPSPLNPEDLSKLEPRWVRSRLARILTLLEPVIGATMWSPWEANKPLRATWSSLMHAIADAGSQEVKTSADLKKALALLVNLFCRTWTACSEPPAGSSDDSWLKQYVWLLNTMAQILGPAHFTEDILSNTKQDNFEVASTPSHRFSSDRSSPLSPLVVLFGLFFRRPAALADNELYKTSASAILRSLSFSKPTAVARLDLLKRSLDAWTSAQIEDPQSVTTVQPWAAILEDTEDALTRHDTLSNHQQDPSSLGRALTNARYILILYIQQSRGDVESVEGATRLYDAMSNAAEQKAAEGGVVIGLMEPIAKSITTVSPNVTVDMKLLLTAHMLKKAAWPKTKQSFNQACKTLSGFELASDKAGIFEPFDHVYSLVSDLMISAYENYNSGKDTTLPRICELFASILFFLQASPRLQLVNALCKLQAGFIVWIKDQEEKMSLCEDVETAFLATWDGLLRSLQTPALTIDSIVLQPLSPLLAAAFSSPQRSIVSGTIETWNETFGRQETLEYSAHLESVLRARLVDSTISLPSFPKSNEDNQIATLPKLYDAQTERLDRLGLFEISDGSGKNMSTSFPLRPIVQNTYATALRSPARSQAVRPSHVHGASPQSPSTTPKARLRHDDSQICFASIDSSPLRTDDESHLSTEHQTEVKAIECENAQMLPDFSSSPMGHSTIVPRTLFKRLDFTSNSRTADTEAVGTPTGLHDSNNMASDDLPSSPTPSSNKDATPSLIGRTDVDSDLADEQQDPPSSPPRDYERRDGIELPAPSSLNGLHEPLADATTFEYVRVESNFDNAQIDVHTTADGKTIADREHDTFSEFESILPTEQLRLEEQAAAQVGKDIVQITNREGAKGVENLDISTASDRRDEHTTEDFDSQTKTDKHDSAEDEQLARIKNSFVETNFNETEQHSSSGSGCIRESPAGGKRKRSSSVVHTTKKRKQQGSLKRYFSNLFRPSQNKDEDNDCDIEDEIVFASSVNRVQPDPIERPTVEVKSNPQTVEQPKRRRGRPPKSETIARSQREAEQKSLKRKASTLSNGSVSEGEPETSVVRDTPALTRARKYHTLKAVAIVPSSPEEQDTRHTGTRRAATSAIFNHQDSTGLQSDAPAADGIGEHVRPLKQFVEGGATAIDSRPIASPRSIIERLHGVLGELRGVLLGSQEERDFDDVLFELRKEVHEAGRRGREQQ